VLPHGHLVSAFLTWYQSFGLGTPSISRFVEEGEMASNRPRPPTINSEGKLDAMNYLLRKFKMTVILQAYNLWDTPIGNDLEPQPMRDSMGNVTSLTDRAVVLGWKH